MSVTMARCAPSKRLRSDDLPALGGPTIAILNPSRIILPCSDRMMRSSSWLRMGWRSRRILLVSASPISSLKSTEASMAARCLVSTLSMLSMDLCRAPLLPSFAMASCLRVEARTVSLMYSAWVRSRFPLRKARSLNSPGRAMRAPLAMRFSQRVATESDDPWTWISAVSSPV